MTTQLNSKNHYDLISQFERDFPHNRLDKEEKSLWRIGQIYQNGEVNRLFLAYRQGYSLAKIKSESSDIHTTEGSQFGMGA